ncbi:MAG: cyclic nucleotide-binding/CBS domain-containing protein [Candidatus Woesearchaeota archaeon]
MGALRVADAMSRRPIMVPRHMRIDECARTMKRHSVGSVIVGTGSVFVGLVTEQDLVHSVIAQGAEPSELCVADIMSTDVVTVAPELELSEAMRRMTRHRIRHLPVLEENRLVGFLTIKDLLDIQPALIEIFTERNRQKEL